MMSQPASRLQKRLVLRSAFAEFLRDAAEGQSSAFFYAISGGDEYVCSIMLKD